MTTDKPHAPVAAVLEMAAHVCLDHVRAFTKLGYPSDVIVALANAAADIRALANSKRVAPAIDMVAFAERFASMIKHEQRNTFAEVRYWVDQYKLFASDLLAAANLLPSSAPVVSDEWQPIETAPKKAGKHLLLFGDGHNFSTCVFVGYWRGVAWGTFDTKECKPTHWRPLPAPPGAITASPASPKVNALREALEQIIVVCDDNASAACNQAMALTFVCSIARAALASKEG